MAGGLVCAVGHDPNITSTPKKKLNTMDKLTQVISHDLGTLADDVRALLNATVDVGGEKISEARQRLATALDSGQSILGRAKAKVIEGGRATDAAVHEHPYHTLGIALGMVAVIGYLVMRRCSRNGG
jgi:ElaB/YqjD/DUF883 family membrane-anchored ribosome-binding protein